MPKAQYSIVSPDFGGVGSLGLWSPAGREQGPAVLLPPGGRRLPCSLASEGNRWCLAKRDVCLGLTDPPHAQASLSAAALRDQRVWHRWYGARVQRPGEHRAGRRCGQPPRRSAQAWDRCAGWLLRGRWAEAGFWGLPSTSPTHAHTHARPATPTHFGWAEPPQHQGQGVGNTRKPNPALFLAWKKTQPPTLWC